MKLTERRPYRMQRRAERQQETRRRIVEAAVELHTTVGPAQTSLSAVAERAGVERNTVYAHFPTAPDLFRACSAHWDAQHPFPDAAAWLEVRDPYERLHRALMDIYAWYDDVEHDLALLFRDRDLIEEQIAEIELQMLAPRDLLVQGLPRRRRVRAAVGHALDFETWRSLERRQRLPRRDAVALAVALVEVAAT